MAEKIGPWFEGKVHESLDRLRAKEGLFYHRLKDSKAAGRYLPNSPADYLVAANGNAWLVECKASEKHLSFLQCWKDMVDADQIAHHRWWNRTNNHSCFLFYAERLGMVEVWPGPNVAWAWDEKNPLNDEGGWKFPLGEIDAELWSLFS